MRLTNFEQKAIIQIGKQIFGNDVIIYLFGSRVDDEKK